MEKTIVIDGKNVTFKATGGIGYRYKAQFGREYIADAIQMEEFLLSTKAGVNGGDEANPLYDLTKYSLECVYNILWTLAKTANENIPSPQQWLDSFDTFPVMDIFEQVKDIMVQNLKADPKNA